MHNDELHDYLRTIGTRGGETPSTPGPTPRFRESQQDYSRSALTSGCSSGTAVKEFTSYHLPDRSFVYLLHAVLAQEHGSPRRAIDSEEWRMFLMGTRDIERELLRLHQFKELDYQVAGSLAQLTLPCENALAYAHEMVA